MLVKFDQDWSKDDQRMILSLSTYCLCWFSCKALAVVQQSVLLFFFFKASLHWSSGRLHWFLAIRIQKDSINHCHVWLCVFLTIGHPEHFPHASHLGNILSNILLSYAANLPGLPVGTPAAGASKRPQSYTLRLQSLASALGQGRAWQRSYTPMQMIMVHSMQYKQS